MNRKGWRAICLVSRRLLRPDDRKPRKSCGAHVLRKAGRAGLMRKSGSAQRSNRLTAMKFNLLTLALLYILPFHAECGNPLVPDVGMADPHLRVIESPTGKPTFLLFVSVLEVLSKLISDAILIRLEFYRLSTPLQESNDLL